MEIENLIELGPVKSYVKSVVLDSIHVPVQLFSAVFHNYPKVAGQLLLLFV